MTARSPVEFVRKEADGTYSRVGNNVQLEDGSGSVVSPTNPLPVDVDGVAVPAGDPVVGQVVIAVTGTAVRLSVASVSLPTSSVLVYALSGNTAIGVVGPAGVTNTIDGTGNGYILEAGQSVVIMTDDLNTVWVNGTAGDIFTYSAG